MAVLALLQYLANGAIRYEREIGEWENFLAKDNNWFLSQSHFQRPVLAVRRASTGPRAQQGKKPGVVCAYTGADHTGGPGNRGIPVGAGQSFRNVPLGPE